MKCVKNIRIAVRSLNENVPSERNLYLFIVCSMSLSKWTGWQNTVISPLSHIDKHFNSYVCRFYNSCLHFICLDKRSSWLRFKWRNETRNALIFVPSSWRGPEIIGFLIFRILFLCVSCSYKIIKNGKTIIWNS